MIYLDNNATTSLNPQVLKAMLQDLKGPAYNPSARHLLGRKAHALLLNARAKIAERFNCLTDEVIFTSSATEALNLAMRSFAKKGGHLITSNIEHSAIYNTALNLKRQGMQTTFLAPQKNGTVTTDMLEKAIKPNSCLIVLSETNNETGSLNNIKKLSQIAEKHGIAFLVDAVASIGKHPFIFYSAIAGFVFSGHKIHGPKGIGVLILKKEFNLTPLITGGSQENLKRAGTENLAGILGLAKALELALDNLEHNMQKMENLRNLFENEIFKQVKLPPPKNKKLNILINGGEKRICNVSNLYFEDILAEDLLIFLDQQQIAASHGSACSSKDTVLSRVISNTYSPKRAKSSLRFSFSHQNTEEEIQKAVKTLISSCYQLRS